VWVQSIAHQFGSRMALISVFTTAIHGIMIGSGFEGTIKSTFFIAIACYLLGLIVGEMGRRLVEDQVRMEFEQAKVNQDLTH
jgi:predicted translin family RNA/ssDNA-binding protein